MFRKFALTLSAMLVLGLPTAAFAEDSSSSYTGQLRAMTARAWGPGYYYGGYAGGGYYPYATRSVGLYRYGHGYGGHYRRGVHYGAWGRRY
ncbi:MAG: hypothetical protein E6G97_16460 [Alphaproteobacteria bacterium]|nr:MAG: hypothetical protein E6G97_16460 [Alphaproteobacteria bacterium]